MLAPINKPTGDGRRMATGAFRHRPLPLALKWQRVDAMGHDASVVIGLVDVLNIDEGSGEVWAEGELFDDRPDLPRLAEDVGEALLLTEKRVIGPSVDAGAASAVLVESGSDEPVSEERMEELFWESVESGTDPDVEMLFTDYEIAAATLVPIPAFVEARPFELLLEDPTDDEDEDKPDDEDEDEPVEEQVPARASAALVASLTAAAPAYPIDAFLLPDGFDVVAPLTVEDRGEGFLRVYGYVAAAGTCHLQFRDMCVTPPTSATDYAVFHRYPLQLDDGDLLGVGRITTGHGKVGTGCTCCPGKDDHACDQASFASTIGHYDRLTTLAHVRAGEDERGTWLAGVAPLELAPSDLAVLRGERFSGDWRDVAGNLELVEVLALATGRPGFPLPSTALRDGRQVSLTAAGGIPPRPDGAPPLGAVRALSALRAELDRAVAPLAAAVADLGQRLAPTFVEPAIDAAADLEEQPEAEAVLPEVEAANLTHQIVAALNADDADRRTREAKKLLAELEV
jgi:hypothetical protein